MRITSIRAKLYTATIFFLLIITFFAINYYLYNLQIVSEQKFHKIAKCDLKFANFIIYEQAALRDPDKIAGLSGKYNKLRNVCLGCHSEPDDTSSMALDKRRMMFEKLSKLSQETEKNYTDVNSILISLASSVQYIHEHHIAYLKNFIHRNQVTQDYDADNALIRSSDKAASEPEIIKSAIAIQTNLLSIYNIFNRLQLNSNQQSQKNDFSVKIKQFYLSVNTFENNSLDAQDGILVEELLQTGREFEEMFTHLLAVETEKMFLADWLKQNQLQLTEALSRLRSNFENKHTELSGKIKLLQFVALLFTLIFGGLILFIGKRILNQVRKIEVEVQKIEQDLSYEIDIDNSIPDEFRVGFKALNAMSAGINEHIEKLDTAYLELSQVNRELKTEIVERQQIEVVLRRYEHIISSTSDHMSYLDRDYVYLAVNDAYLKAFQKNREEIVGHSVMDLLGADIFESLVKEKLDRSLAGEEVRYQSWFDFPKTGRIFMDVAYHPYVNVSGEIVGVVVNSRDITMLKNVEEKLLVEHARFVAVMDSLDAYVYAADMETHELIFVNRCVQDTFGDVVGKICWQALQNRQDGPCTFCTNDKLLSPNGELTVPYVWEFFNTINNEWYQCRDQAIRWPDGRLVRLEIATNITERKRAEEQVKTSLKEREVLLREIHHRVKNNMQVIVSLLRLHSRRIDDPRMEEIFNECRDRIYAMSLIHESLYQSKDLAQIDFEVYIQKLCRNLNQVYGALEKGIVVVVERGNVSLGMDQGIAVGMVISELVANAFKHAFPEGHGGRVSISLTELDGNAVELIVEDDGIGLAAEIDILKSPSLGLDLAVSAVTRELGGEIRVERDNGTRFVINFKCVNH